MPFVHAFGALALTGSAILLYDAARCWTERGRWWISRLHATLLGVACIGFIWFVLMWHLLVPPRT